MIPPEGQTVERKESLGERREIVETCAAFASAQGGRIYIGVRRNTSMAAKIEGKLERTERWEYPPDAVREAITNAVNPRQFKAVKQAIEHGRLTRPDYERIAGVARATANRDLTDLTERGVLRQGGAARRTWYEFIFSGNEKIRETILPEKLAEKPSVETNREKKVSRKCAET